MSEVEELQRVIAKLSPADFKRLTDWVLGRQEVLCENESRAPLFRDHTAFLNGYSPEDEGLYENAQSR